jgi:hypothetical protein
LFGEFPEGLAGRVLEDSIESRISCSLSLEASLEVSRRFLSFKMILQTILDTSNASQKFQDDPKPALLKLP